jgi:thymidylate synthase
MQQISTINTFYKDLVTEILHNGIEETNARTGMKTKIVTGINATFEPAVSFPLLTLRKIPLKLFIAEMIWYLQGVKELDFFQQYSKIWDDFMDEGNVAESGYGYRWRNHFGRDQIASLVNTLSADPSSRQGVVVTWDANNDGLDSAPKKNVPCVPMWVANIVGGKLNLHFTFRSNDVMLGMPHDIAGFAILQAILAQKLNVKIGKLHYSGIHCHIYENHYNQAHELIKRELPPESNIQLALPVNTYERAMAGDLELVNEIFDSLKAQYDPLPSLGKMQIAL